MDAEFAVQYLVLAHAAAHPELQGNVGNIALLQRAEACGLLPAGVGEAAANAYRELRRAQHRARLDEQPTQFPADDAGRRARCRARAVARGVRRLSAVAAASRRRTARLGRLGDRAGVGRRGALVCAARGARLAAAAGASTQPWRLWTAAFVHWSPLHLQANLLGCVRGGRIRRRRTRAAPRGLGLAGGLASDACGAGAAAAAAALRRPVGRAARRRGRRRIAPRVAGAAAGAA